MTLLNIASMHGHIQVIKHLVKSGAKVDKPDLQRRTPLSWAAENGHLDAVKLLVELGANINSKDKNGGTPLAWVVCEGQGDRIDEVFDYLVSQGAKEFLQYSCLHKLRVQWLNVREKFI
ncbi:ankyrin repeat-containing domain protein [Aspergillus spectabilis]